jgi:hypothetical protein
MEAGDGAIERGNRMMTAGNNVVTKQCGFTVSVNPQI